MRPSAATAQFPFPKLLLLPLLAAALAGCTGLPSVDPGPGAVVGEGEVVSEDRTTGEFDHVSVASGMTVTITEGTPTSVTLTAQANLLPLIRTEVVDGQLVVNVESPGISTSEPLTLAVVAPDVASLALSGGANGTLETDRDALVIDVSGGAVLTATGTAEDIKVHASSGAQARLGDLVASTGAVVASGGSQVEISVEDALTGEATGGATIRLVQQPASVDVATSGGGMVIGG